MPYKLISEFALKAKYTNHTSTKLYSYQLEDALNKIEKEGWSLKTMYKEDHNVKIFVFHKEDEEKETEPYEMT